MKIFPLFIAFILPALAVDSVVTFNEVHYNPDTGSEWIEIHNQMAINVDLSGWELTGGADFVIPAGTTIPGGGYFIIAKNPAEAIFSGLSVDGPFDGALSNSGETIRLRSSSGRLMDELDYEDSGQWPIGPDGSGATLSKLNQSFLSDKSSSWASSSQLGGTPGAINFPDASSIPAIPHTFVASDASWRFEDALTAPPANWNTTAFNDSSWSSGESSFGAGAASSENSTLTVTDHLVERFRASDLSLSNNQLVNSWPDSATGDGVTQNATRGGNPTFVTNATPSGQPAIRFDGNDQLRTTVVPGIEATSGFVYFAVIKANSTPGNGGVTNGNGPYIWDRVDTVDSPLVSLKSDGGEYGFQKRDDNRNGLGGPVSTTSISTSNYQIVALRRNRTDGLFEIWVDGTREAAQADPGTPLTPQPIVIGNHSTGTIGFDGDIAELLIYEEELTSNEFDAVGSYLESRYGLNTAFPDSTVNTPITATGTTAYFRQSFTFNGSPSDTTVRLDHLTADGAVFYLNGTEVERFNMPAGPITHNSRALSDISSPAASGPITLPAAVLQSGNNTLAISLHPAASDTSVIFTATLEGTEIPSVDSSTSGLVLNEVSPAGDSEFFIEITNLSDTPLSTDGYVLRIESTTIALPNTTLSPGGILLLDQNTLGIIPTSGDKLFLIPSGGTTLADAREVTNRLRGLSSDYEGQWIFPNASTPGLANTFTFTTDIVINEICYNPPILDATPASPSRNSEAQWLELHNRGSQTIDLSNWDFGEGIDYTFPFGTSLAPGGYLVISNDPTTLSAQHPGITILGPFDGNLSRRSETVTLRDDNNNPADTLRYFDGGRWPSKADAGGSTLELIDPDADNSLPAAWANSDELDRTFWQNYTFRATAAASTVGPDTQWSEFIFGMLEEGELLIDDITVTENPDGTAVAMISDGTFESGNLNAWRALGSHGDAGIVPDPDGGGNVLYVNATGSTDHMHNHLETTLRNNLTVVNGREYEVSFRARWLSGAHLLNTRLYFNRVPHTFVLDRPNILGTPGAANSTLVSNSGPTSENLAHSPVVPASGQPTTISIDATDPDGVDAITLHYRVEGGTFSTTAMSQVGNSTTWQADIPGQNSGNVVQFYLTATDTLGASSFIPADGPDSRAMYEVEDNRAATSTCINNFRIIMDPDDLIFMETPRNLMSNGRIPCTIIDRENTAYYDVGVRLKGSHRARANSNRIGFNVGFSSDKLFRNVHRSVALDRSEGQVVGQRELLFDIMATSSGGVPGEFNDLAFVISPNPIHTSPAILQLARFGSVFLEDQFEDGSDGTVYEYELIYYPTTTDAGGYKVTQPDVVIPRDINDMGDDPENYRWVWLIKNNQEFDDYVPAVTLGKQFSKSTVEFNASIADVIDVDQWLRALAYSCATGATDSFYNNSDHNGQFYGRPEDGKILYFPHDMDFAFNNVNLGIFRNTELNRIIANQTYRRAYLAHLYDICSNTYNQAWMSQWTTHLDECIPGGDVFTDDLNYINTRSNFILSQVNAQVTPVNFAISTNNGNNFSTTDSPVTLSGIGWLDIAQIRLSNGTVLDHTWTTTDDWTLDLTLGQGTHAIVLEAYDNQGTLLASDSITITQNGGFETPDMTNLVISEIYYNPPGSGDPTEFIELLNVGSTALDLSGSSFTDGVDFIFPEGTTLAPDEHIIVVADQVAFTAANGAGLNIAGEFANGTGLSNGGEDITLQSNTGAIIQSFAYSDDAPWPTEADGDGFSLVLIQPNALPDHSLPESWRLSARTGGSPSVTDSSPAFAGTASDDNDGDTLSSLIEHYLGTSDNAPQSGADNPIQAGFTTENGLSYPSLTVTYEVGKDDVQASAAVSTDLDDWSNLPADITIHSQTFHGDGTATIIWRSTTPTSDLVKQFLRLQVVVL